MGNSPVFDAAAITARHHGLTVIRGVRGGGQKSVWEVSYNGDRYALKVMNSATDAIERAKREIDIMRKCDCPHLVKLGPLPLQNIQVGGQAYIYYLEEFIDGTALDQEPKPMNLDLCKKLGLHLGAALKSLWGNRVVHRDIKPGNTMLRADRVNFVLLDVGFALDLADSSITGAGLIVGTQLYLSPDQIRLAKRQLDFRSDLHAIGLCMYECLIGLHPLWNPNVNRTDLKDNILNLPPLPLTQFRAEVPPSLEMIVLRLLEKEPHLRYSRIDYFIDELEAVQLP